MSPVAMTMGVAIGAALVGAISGALFTGRLQRSRHAAAEALARSKIEAATAQDRARALRTGRADTPR